MRKNLKNILLLLTITTTAWLFTGCGDGGQTDTVSQTEEINQTEQSANAENDKEGGQDKIEKRQAKGESSDQPIDEDQVTDNYAPADEDTDKSADAPASDAFVASSNESAELCVDVESIGNNSVVGNKISTEASPDGNGEIMLVGAGGDNQVLVTVYFEENASYVYETIRNGGADVETREGSFSDIGLDMILDLTGYYKGEDFYADKVVISNVILD